MYARVKIKLTKTAIFLFFITAISLAYRARGITQSYPFWVDEFSSASQATQILNHGFSFFTSSYHPELNNIMTHFIIALSFSLFGVSEYAARLPFVVVGALVPLAIYILARRYFDTGVALMSALLTACSYFLIVWSRQARGYSLQALLTIGMISYYLSLRNKKLTIGNITTFISIAVVGLLTHSIFILVLLAVALDALYIRLKRPIGSGQTTWLLLTISGITVLLFAIFFGYVNVLTSSILGRLFQTNNLWYYHSFLWREYGLISFLGFIGLVIAFQKQRSIVRPILIFIGLQLIFICFIWPPYSSRYLITIFPFLFIGVAVSIRKLVKPMFAGVVIVILIIANGHKFVPKPKVYYSINHDFREISNVDYNEIYAIIKGKGLIKEGKTAVIDTWHDRLFWYMGQSYPAAYLFRWIDGSDRINGLAQHTDYSLNTRGEKNIPDRPSLRFIGELSDLKRAIQAYPRGFLLVDDSSLPTDVLEYAQKNFKKELYIERYPLDDNPYSIWPTTLYSWGIK